MYIRKGTTVFSRKEKPVVVVVGVEGQLRGRDSRGDNRHAGITDRVTRATRATVLAFLQLSCICPMTSNLASYPFLRPLRITQNLSRSH